MPSTLNRIASGLAAAAATGALYAALVVMLSAANDKMAAGDILANGVQSAAAGAVFGVIVGGLPAVAMIFLTRARYAPWRGAFFLVAGAAIGMLAVTALATLLSKTLSSAIAEEGMMMLVVGALAGAIAASRFLPKSPGA